MLKLAGIIALCIAMAVAGVAYYAGMFDPLEITEEQCGPFRLMYREYRGPYKAVRLMMNNVYRYARDTLHLKTETGFAVFYDDPQSRADMLRSISGVIIDDSLKSLPPPYKTGTFRRTEAVVGRFRLRSFFSYATGSYKFYEGLSRFSAAQKINRSGPVMEIYEPSHRSLRFIWPRDNTVPSVPLFSGH